MSWWQKPRHTSLGQACESARLGIKRDTAPALRLVTPTKHTAVPLGCIPGASN